MTDTNENQAVEQAPANENKSIQLNNSKELSAVLAASDSKALEKSKPVLAVNATTFELKNPGDSIRGIFWGFGVMTTKDRESEGTVERTSVQIIKDRQIHMNCGVNLVGTFSTANLAQGTPVEIKLSKIDGNVKIYDVNILG